MALSLKEQLGNLILSLPNVRLQKSRFSSNEAFISAGREFAHFHDDDVIHIRLTQKVIRQLQIELRQDARITLRKSSDWLEFAFGDEQDLEKAVVLVQLALDANNAREP